MRTARRRMLSCMFVVTILLHQGSCVKNPVTGKRQLALISEAQEIAIGQESHVDPDQALSAGTPVKVIRPGR